MNTPAAPCRTMPTEDDVDEITAISRAYSGDGWIGEVTATSGGVLVSYSHSYSNSPGPALEAVGYTTTRLREGLVLVTGALDALALVEGQIAALQRRRAELVAERQGGQEFEELMGGRF